jgi:hypothetical protein
MKKIITITFAVISAFVAGCATTDMRSPTATTSTGAVVKSRSVHREHYRDILMFAIIDGRPVDPGFWRAPARMEVAVAVGMHAITFDLERHSGFFGGLMGASGVVRFEAKEGRTYVMNSEDADGLVRVWVEDEASGQKVSEPASATLAPRSVGGGAIPIFIPMK